MVSSIRILLLFLFVIRSAAQRPILPKAAFIPVTKDSSSNQYTASVFLGDFRSPLKLVLDLNAPFVWFKCDPGSRKSIESCSLKCSMAGGVKTCCFRNSDCSGSKMCSLTAENSLSRVSSSTEMNEDELSLRFINGVNSADSTAKIEQFLFSCAPNWLLKGLSSSSRGVIGLGNSRISLPSQFSGAFGFFQRKFSLYLSPTKGAIFLGGNPFETQINMIYTPLFSNKDGYHINLQSLKISGKKMSVNQKAKLNTLLPYTIMETKMYHTFIKAYIEAAISMNLTLVSSITPFDVCFSSKVAGERQVLPVIDLVLQSEMVIWRINESNAFVNVNDEVICLGFIDGGLKQKDVIVLGGVQLENHLLEFNLGNSMLGFSSLEVSEFSDFDVYGEI